MESSRIALPSLSPRYELALRAASVYVFSEFDPFAVVVSGSIVRGNPDPASDFNIIVIHRHSWRRRVQKWFEVSQLKSS
jgi:predicted nucleotidyltransferase